LTGDHETAMVGLMTSDTRIVGDYEILRPIGRGGMAVVYLARQLRLDRLVALKELAGFHVADPTLAQRFVREAKLAGGLSHPHVVTVFDYFEWDGTPYISMEYVERGSLRPYVGSLAVSQVGGVLVDVLAGLAHAHQQGVVHRDVKPENLMITPEGRVKVADFGIAKATDEMQTAGFVTATGMTVGTPAYMAPEQVMGEAVGPATDLYSIGCVAYELLLGRTPFAGSGTAMAVLHRHLNEIPVPPCQLDPSISPALSAWIERLLIKDPAERPGSAGEAVEALEDLLDADLGSRWRRGARLGPPPGTPVPGPWTPPPADAPPVVPGPWTPPPVATPSGEFVTYDPFADDAPSAREPQPEQLDTPPPLAPPAPEIDEAFTEPPAATTPPRRPLPAAVEPPVRRRRIAAATVGIALLAAVAVAAVLVSGSGDKPADRAAKSPAGAELAAGPFRVQSPSGWRELDESPRVTGLKLRKAASAAPGGRAADGTVTVGFAPPSAHNQALLPREFLAALGLREGVVPRHETTHVGKQDWAAYRYAGLDAPGSAGPVTAYVVPTTAGVVTLACRDPSSDVSIDAACRSVAGSLTAAPSVAPYPLGPSDAYAKQLNAAFSTLANARGKDHARMRKGPLARDQAPAAADLAATYRDTRAKLAALDLSPADELGQRRMTDSLRAASRAYRDLADAARRADESDYNAAARRVARTETAVRDRLRAIEAAGYAKLVTARLPSAPPPEMKPAQAAATPTPSPGPTPSPDPGPAPTAPPSPTATPEPLPEPIP
jgi:serine/threonine protein kinase